MRLSISLIEQRYSYFGNYYFSEIIHSFGLVCSPLLHCAVIRHHLDTFSVECPEHRASLENVKNTFYVHDVTTDARSLTEAKLKVQTLFDAFQSGPFRLRKWCTNSSEMAKFISQVSPIPDTVVSSGEK